MTFDAPREPPPARLKPTDPYPTWPFTIVDPKDLEQWCKKNVRRVREDAKQYEEAPW